MFHFSYWFTIRLICSIFILLFCFDKLYFEYFWKQNEDNGNTLLHLTAGRGDGSFVKILLQYGADLNIKNKKDRTALEEAIHLRKNETIEILKLSKIGGRTREKIGQITNRIERQHNMIDYLLQYFGIKKDVKKDKNKNYETCLAIVNSIIQLLKEKLPLSEDLLLFCVKFSKIFYNDNFYESPFWKQLIETCNQVFDVKNPNKQRDYVWFKQYIFDSIIWYPSINDNSLSLTDKTKTQTNESEKKSDESGGMVLFEKLHSMAANNLKPQTVFLKEALEKVMKEEKESFEEIINFEQFSVCRKGESLRQDVVKCISLRESIFFLETFLE